MRSRAIVLLSFLIFFTTSCTSTKKLQELEAKNKAVEEEKAAQKQAIDQANARIEALEQQLEEQQKAKEEQKAVSEQEISQVKKTYETLVQDLKKEMDSGKINIEQTKGEVKLKIAEELFFETGEAEIKPEGQKILLRIGKDLQKVTRMNIRVEGHTDNVPIGPSLREQYPTNWELAAARAINVVRFLQEKAGIDPGRLSVVAFAQYRPVASNKTEAGRTRNRRVEIVLVERELEKAKRTKGTAKK